MSANPRPPSPNGLATIGLAAGGDPPQTLDRTLALLGGLDWAAGLTDPILILVGSGRTTTASGWLATGLLAALRRTTRAEVRIVRPPSVLGTIRSPAPDDPNWARLPTAAGAERFDRVIVPRALATAGALCLVVPPLAGPATGPLALETLARHAHPQQALAARLDRGRSGLAAELASPLEPRLIVVRSGFLGEPVVAATGDRIAAELIGLALRDEHAGTDDSIGPWEDPLVQRATELDLGARLPRDLALVPSWAGDLASPRGAPFHAMADRLRLRIGVPVSAEPDGERPNKTNRAS